MDAMSYARAQLEQSLNLLDVAVDGMDAAQYNYRPGGTCNPPAASHVHALTGIDALLLTRAGGQEMRWPALARAHGMPANPREIWGYEGTIPPDAVKDYARDVRESSLAFISGLAADDLDRRVQTPLGEQCLAFLIQLMSTHAAGHAGEIAAVKGMQGLKGLPF